MKKMFVVLVILILVQMTSTAQEFIEICRGANQSPDIILIRSGAGSGFDRVSTIEPGEEVNYLTETQDAQGQVWGKVVDQSGTEGYVASWLITKTDCLSVEVLPTSGENCQTIFKYQNLMFEAEGLLKYSGFLSINQIVDIANLVDSYFPNGTYTDKQILIYFIPTMEEYQRVFSGWGENTLGAYGSVQLDDCHLVPYENGINWNIVAVLYDQSIIGTLVHELAHSMGAEHGPFGTIQGGLDPSIPREMDAFYWERLVVVSLVQGCDMLTTYSLEEEMDRVLCPQIREIFE